MMTQVIEIFRLYHGSSLYMTLFCCGLLYLWLTEQDKSLRVVLIYVSATILFLFFFPLFSYFMIHFILDGEVYYRILWFLPMSIVVAYAAVRVISRQTQMLRKVVLSLMVCLVLCMGGDYTYDNPTFEPTENLYHLPQTVVDICDAIMPQEGEEWVCAAMPQELLSYVRQYTTQIHMPYGRAVLIKRWNLPHPMYDTMEAAVIDVKLLTEQAREYGCHYIVLEESRAMDGNPEEQGFRLVTNVDGYNIYLDRDNNRGL
ncbi:MAG: hypothetical protein RRX92_09630 [Lachnospiraceae bacterium]